MDPHWLIVNFAQRAYPHSLRIWEHANPRDAAGFVSSVDLRADSGWITNVWQLAAGEDQTVCGGTLTLYAANSPIVGEQSRATAPRKCPAPPSHRPHRLLDPVAGLQDLLVDAARIRTQTTISAWEYIDAVQVSQQPTRPASRLPR